MRCAARLLPAVVAVVLLSAACGSEHADSLGAASPTASPSSATARAVDGVRITSVTIPPVGSTPNSAPGPSAGAADPEISATYEVTNSDTEAFTYTILFMFTTDTGGAMSSQTETVRSVGPGATVRGTVRLAASARWVSPEDRVTGVKVAEVTRVPASEAPPAPGECPRSGIRLSLGDGTAATGLRAVDLRLENCGTRDYALDGYPLLELLDKDRSPVGGVQIVHGSGGASTSVPGLDEPVRPLVLKPGDSAASGLMWRNTNDSIVDLPVNVPYLRVRARQGADPVIVTLHLDLGTTGKLTVSPWALPSR
ncbi:DUF4232 domain-containing protein [Parafrankia sp. EUN1f]|uniref:DUF4232 domain-containing protein n=1 Tax=Parafrankia sp. EUN1f TaxID=102897 RepID=UPI0001C44A4B|nr:DUF4232 domain-containing protein [Parafrankia sp. EUN1f]EFC84801.1 hypothetical protein FrEUN1fDRAFT_2118 [Parafrankia sp. EUN1f]